MEINLYDASMHERKKMINRNTAKYLKRQYKYKYK